MEGGELFSRIQERGDQAFTERGTCMQQDSGAFGQRRAAQHCCAMLGKALLLFMCQSPLLNKRGWDRVSKEFHEFVTHRQR